MALIRGGGQVRLHVLIMSKITANLLYGIVWVLSLLPLPVLYLISDIVWFIMFVCPSLRYRKKIVRKNLELSFPENDRKWLRRTERRFYYQFLCQIMESLKTVSAGRRWVQRHMVFTGYESMVQETLKGRSHVCYIGHMGNWEWIPSLMYHFEDVDKFVGCQVYHKLENPVMEQFMLKLRSKFGTESIPMENVLRRLLEYKKEDKKYMIGMIADQVPLWWNVHYWTQFMNRKTPVFSGAERLSRKMDTYVWYIHVTRPRRGHYICDIQPMFEHTAELPEFTVTERYMRLLEDNIRESPELWLWTHNRWKRNWEGYQKWLANHPVIARSHSAEK